MYENETFSSILDRVMARMPDSTDKRPSSFLYNASAPLAVEWQNVYIALDNILNITFFDTADREGKLNRCKERLIDVTQFEATHAICTMVTVPAGVDIPVGSRFNYNEINFSVTEKVTDGEYRVQCNEEGTAGNVTGMVTPVDYINGLQSAEITSIYQYGEDEADESLIDEIYYASLNSQAFGGNRADYLQKVRSIAGVGDVKVYSGAEWQGGGTVKLVFTTSSYTKPESSFVNLIQSLIDPVENQGEGYGIAPIGHTVTVAGVDEQTVNVSFSVVLQEGYTWEDVSGYVDEAIDAYFLSLNKEWGDSGNIIVRISQLETRLLGVTGIIDVADTALNGSESNLSVPADSIVVRGSVNATT